MLAKWLSAFPLHKFRVFVLMELIISQFPLLPDVSCLPPSLLLILPFVSGLFPGSGKCQTSVSPLPAGMAAHSPVSFHWVHYSAPGDT